MKKSKIKLDDCECLRDEIVLLYEQSSQLAVASWAIAIAQRIMKEAGIEKDSFPEIREAFTTHQLWKEGLARVHDVRQAGFALHRLARRQENEQDTVLFRVLGQAIGTGHMKEHALVASDYAIKYVNLRYPKDALRVEEERQWQLSQLKDITSKRISI